MYKKHLFTQLLSVLGGLSLIPLGALVNLWRIAPAPDDR
jgi:hypothetical protein